MDPTIGELARRLDGVATDVRECRDLMRVHEDRLDDVYVRREVFVERGHLIDVQLEGIEATQHSHGQRMEAHEKSHERERESRDASRRALMIAVTAATLSPLISALIIVFGH